MASRSKRAQIAEETVRIVQAGKYEHPTAGTIFIKPLVQHAIDGTVHYSPESIEEAIAQRETKLAGMDRTTPTRFVVRNQTTFGGARELLSESDSPVLCLNFASAKNPGGGFLGGSQAQEECLARASALYDCIHPVRRFYDTNRACGTSLYTHHIIYSPAVPVFRDDNDEFIAIPYCVSIITAPAVNRGAMETNEREDLGKIESTMLDRIDRILTIAVAKGYRRLVLGAWGCGVFRNDPEDVANWFAQQLTDPRYRNAFETVYFAVLDQTSSQKAFQSFESVFR